MNLNQLINMVIRMLTRRAVNFGIDKGAEMLATRDKGKSAPQQQAQARKLAKRARQAARLSRRMR